jgi:hypothetical protein
VNLLDAELTSDDLLKRIEAYAPNKAVLSNATDTVNNALRAVLWVCVLALHLGFIAWMYHEHTRDALSNNGEVITVLEFISRPKPKPKSEDKVAVRQVTPIKNDVQENIRVVPKQIRAIESPTKKPAETRSKSLSLYDSTGKVQLNPEFVENFDQKHNVPTRFDFQNPNLELAGTFLKRPPAMDFEPTQFEEAWRPNQNILDELLTKAVEKTTGEVKIPVPGNPTVKLVCKVSVLALGGGCGFVPNGGYGRVIPDSEDDPKTLSIKEQKACQAWWNKITDTRSQSEWIKTKELYEIECKKPFAKEKSWPK